MAKKTRITTNGYVMVVDQNKLKNADISDYEYEHRVVAEELIGRPLQRDEAVHHLDNNRSNNSPDNLLVLLESQHVKLHAWQSKNVIVPKPAQLLRNLKGCVRCNVC